MLRLKLSAIYADQVVTSFGAWFISSLQFHVDFIGMADQNIAYVVFLCQRKHIPVVFQYVFRCAPTVVQSIFNDIRVLLDGIKVV